MRRATTVIHISEIKMLLNFPWIILVLTIKVSRNVNENIDHPNVIFLNRPVGRSAGQPEKFLGRQIFLTLSEQPYFVRDNASQSTKRQEMLEIWEAMTPWLRLCPRATWCPRAQRWRPCRNVFCLGEHNTQGTSPPWVNNQGNYITCL